MSIARIVALGCCTAALSGCLTSNVVVTVRPDGSGTIEQTAQLRTSAVAELERLVSPDPASPPPSSLAFLRPPDSRGPSSWGQGIRLRSSRTLNAGGMTGWTAIYDFVDVRALDIDVLPQIAGIDLFAAIGAADKRSNMRLRLTLESIPGPLERLTVHFPRFQLESSLEPPAAWASGSASEMAALKDVLKGSRIKVVIATEAPLVRTNSPYREEDRVVLLDVDVEQAFFSRQMSMLATTPATFDDLLWALGDLPGITLAPEHDVTLEFRDPTAIDEGAVPVDRSSHDTEIFLAPLAIVDGQLRVGTPLDITNSPGDDAQPAFTSDGREILFTSARNTARPASAGTDGGPPPDTQTHIYRYDITTRRTSRVARTPENEHVPAMMPDGAHISMLRAESGGVQSLWSVTIDGSNGAPILRDVKAAAAYVWLDAHTVALLVRGDRGAPETLQLADTSTGRADVVAAVGLGHSLLRLPAGELSFVQRDPAASGSSPAVEIKQLLNAALRFRNIATRAVTLTRPIGGALDADLACMPDGTLLMPHAGSLYRWSQGDRDWTRVVSFEALGLQNVTHLAVSPKGDRLALVARTR